jgi:hypothetical protein
MSGLHPALHNNNIGPTKVREPDREVRKALVDCLILLSSTKETREILRQKKVVSTFIENSLNYKYPLIREAEKPEEDDDICDAMHKLVDLLMFTDDMPTVEEMMQSVKVTDNKTVQPPIINTPPKIMDQEMDIDDEIEEI